MGLEVRDRGDVGAGGPTGGGGRIDRLTEDVDARPEAGFAEALEGGQRPFERLSLSDGFRQRSSELARAFVRASMRAAGSARARRMRRSMCLRLACSQGPSAATSAAAR